MTDRVEPPKLAKDGTHALPDIIGQLARAFGVGKGDNILTQTPAGELEKRPTIGRSR